VVDHLASTHDWTTAPATASTKTPSKKAAKKGTKKAAKKSAKARKGKSTLPEPDEIIAEPVKLYYLIDRRDFLEKLKSVYASYA
jgi:nucleoid-associated protein YgaU